MLYFKCFRRRRGVHLLLRCFRALFFIVSLLVCETKQLCDPQTSVVVDKKSSVEWTYYYHENDQIVFTNPTCIGFNGESESRVCHNGNWIPPQPPICQTVSENDHCPEFLMERNYCIAFIQEPNSNQLNTFSKKQHKILKYIGTKNLPKYPCRIDKDDFMQTQCCLESNVSDQYQKGYCNTTNYLLIIPSDHEFHVCPKNCISAGLGSDNCFCKVFNNTNEQLLATIDSPLTKKTAAKLAGDDICQVKNTYKSFQLQNVSYQIITENFYGLYSQPTNCSIINQPPLVLPEVETNLYLNFEPSRQKLFLMIYNSQNLSPSKSAISCFTDASDEITKRVKIKRREYIVNKNVESTSIYELKLEDLMGQYWCEAFLRNLTKIHSNVALAMKNTKGNEYALRMEIFKPPDNLEEIKENFDLTVFRHLRADLRIMNVYVNNSNYADVLLHISTRRDRNLTEEYFYLNRELTYLPNNFNIKYFNSVEYCLPEVTSLNNSLLHWGLTRFMDSTTPFEICLTEKNQIPLVRTCAGNFLEGSKWSNVDGTCLQDIKVPNTTIYLHQSCSLNVTVDLISNLTEVAKKNLSTYDMFLISNVIENINQQGIHNDNITNGLFNIINELTKHKESLVESQVLLNVSDKILLELDKYIAKNFTSDKTFTFSQENILTVIIYPFKTNISGIYLLGDVTSTLNELQVKYLMKNESIMDIPDVYLDRLQVATHISEKILKDVALVLGDSENIKIIFTVFYEDSLFISPKEKAANKVISIIIPGYGIYLNQSVPIVIRSEIESKKCGYWNYGQSFQRSKGKWSTYGGKYGGELHKKSNLHTCLYSHLTHFALLLVSESIKVDEGIQKVTDFDGFNEDNYFYMSVITIIGGVLSISGIFGIYVTAILFPTWRERIGTRILLHLSTAILLEIIILQFSEVNVIVNSHNRCRLIGSLLHYIVISKFCWMLIYAFLQYLRFVKVLGGIPKYLLLKSTVFGWGVPLFPVGLTVLLAPESYLGNSFCYLSGMPLILAVVVPVNIVVVLNILVFGFIMFHVVRRKLETTEMHFTILQVYLAVLLYFVLGLPWLFGVLAVYVTNAYLKEILMYAFCSTATLQGFILFMFYVVLNSETRNRWKKKFCDAYY